MIEEDIVGGITLDINDNKFNAGDVVKLKADRYDIPMLVVNNAYDVRAKEKRVIVVWTRPDNSLFEAAFPETVLGHYN